MVLWSQKVLLKTLYQIQYGILFAVELSFSNGRYFRVGRYFREGGGGGVVRYFLNSTVFKGRLLKIRYCKTVD